MDKIGKKRAEIIYLTMQNVEVDEIAKQTGYNKSYIYVTRKWFRLLSEEEQKQVYSVAIAKLLERNRLEQKPVPEPDHKMDGFRTPYTVQKNSKRFFYH